MRFFQITNSKFEEKSNEYIHEWIYLEIGYGVTFLVIARHMRTRVHKIRKNTFTIATVWKNVVLIKNSGHRRILNKIQLELLEIQTIRSHPKIDGTTDRIHLRPTDSNWKPDYVFLAEDFNWNHRIRTKCIINHSDATHKHTRTHIITLDSME